MQEHEPFSAEGFRAGNNTDWEAFVRETQPSMRSTLYRTGTRNPADIEDAVQEAYLDVFQRRAQIDLGRNPRAYVVRSAINASIDQRRRAYYRHEVANSDTEHVDVAGEPHTVLDLARASDDVETETVDQVYAEQVGLLINDAVEHLIPEQQTVIRLTAEGLTQAQIAEQTGMPLGSVKSRQSNGRRHLRAHLALQRPDRQVGDDL